MMASPAPNQQRGLPTRLDITWDPIELRQNSHEFTAMASKVSSSVKPGLYAVKAEVHDSPNTLLKNRSLFIVIDLQEDGSAFIRIWPEDKKNELKLDHQTLVGETQFAVWGHRDLNEYDLDFYSGQNEVQSSFASPR